MRRLAFALAFALSAASATAAHQVEADLLGRFRVWAARHGKVYQSESEEQVRLANFRASLARIEAHNSRGASWKMGLNRFADMTDEEFFSGPSTLASWQGRPDCAQNITKRIDPRWSPALRTGVRTVDRIDWREKNVVVPPKDQGHCGSCWAFSAVGAIESAWAIASGSLVSLSEQQLIDCTSPEGNQGCAGGWPGRSFDYVVVQGGLDSERAYPYIGSSHGEDSFKCYYKKYGAKAKITTYYNVANEENLELVVGTIGPASMCFQVTGDFRYYESGVYSSTACSSRTETINHAVLVVGYDVDAATNKPYWIVKNSWGTGWGNSGYFLIERGVNMCGLADCASYPVVGSVS